MDDVPIWRRYLRLLGSDPEADVDDELDFHLSMRMEDLVRRGLSKEEAGRRAEREFGDRSRIRRETAEVARHRQRGAERAEWWDAIAQDLRLALRRLRRSRGFTAVAVVTLALGIGGATTMFSVADGILMRSLPYPEPHELVRVHLASPERDVREGAVSLPDFEDWRDENEVLSHLSAYFSFTRSLTGPDRPVAVRTTYVSDDFFETFGAGARLGRVFSGREVREAAQVVVLSDAVWRTRFGSDPSVVGATVDLDGSPHTVVGVMPPRFMFPDPEVGAWLPLPVLVAADLVPLNRSARWLSVVGRLRPGRTVESAGAHLTSIAGRLADEYPDSNRGWNRANVLDLRETIVGDAGPALLVALAAVGFVLLMVCTNLASLLLARAATGEREMALRAALGAGRARLVRGLFTESLLLALLGGAGGVLLAAGGMGAVRGWISPMLPRVDEIGIDARVLGFAFGITLLTSLLFGMIPALRAARSRAHEALKEGGRGAIGDRRSLLRPGLVVGQVGLAVVLTIGAGLMLRSFQELRRIDPGFDPHGVLAAGVQIPIPPDRGRLRARTVERTRRMLEALRAVPGAEAVGSIDALPLREDGSLLPLSAGGEHAAGEAELLARPRSVSGDYFRVMRIPLLAGELFPETVPGGAPTRALVSDATARRLWPGQDPIGKELWMGIPYRVIGVVGDVRGAGLTEDPPLTVYRHQSQQPLVDVTFVIRTRGEPLALATAVREAISGVDHGQPVGSLHELTDVISGSLSEDRFFTFVLGIFGAAALLLAALGLYGTLSYGVSQRTREIGLRMALGARRGDVVKMVLGQGLLLAGMGVAIGLSGALGATRLLAGMLHGVGTSDPATYAGITLLLIGTALLAAYLPARRATRADPRAALRSD